LSESGHEVHVLKANTEGPVADPGLTRRIPPAVHVHEAFAPEIPFAFRHKVWSKLSASRPGSAAESPVKPSRFSVRRLIVRGIKNLLCPEPEILWIPFALRKARKIIRQHHIEYLLVTVPPFSV